MMNLNIYHLLTKSVPVVILSNLLVFSTGKKPKQKEVGFGTHFVSSVVAANAVNMEQNPKINATLDYENGDKKIQSHPLCQTNENDLSKNTELHQKSLNLCGYLKKIGVQFAIKKLNVFLLTTATQKEMLGSCFARHATHFLDGMKKRQKRYSNLKNMSQGIVGKDQPCHADVLLKLANK